ncbi:MAG: alcohol dehydrogenase catalytic domain-containing protein [Lacunisphaera sp.]|jgi:L-iditol 2-dehydrogenase|nr:alcohol dehydrogenase catalytic domain-containing protein [Lacunisphaera sp.]
MKALVKFQPGPGHVELRDVKEPIPSDHQVKLEITTCGICGTDVHVLHDTFRNFPPVILGHEFVGRIIEEGAAVRDKVDRSARYAVLGATAVKCGKCRWCQSGDFMFCPDRRGMGHGVNGAFTRYACVRPDQLFRLDDSLPDEEGALVEPLAAAVHAVAEITDVRPGDIALVSGPGPIGLLCLLVLAHQGVKTIVAGTTADVTRLALARTLGAARTVDVQQENLEEIIRSETGGARVDVAFEVAGVAASARACLDALRPLGQYTQVGHFGRDITVPFDRIGFRQLRVAGSVGYTVATWSRTMQLLAQGLKPTRIVTHRLPLAEWQRGFEMFERKEATKVLLSP